MSYRRLSPEDISQETYWRKEKLWFQNFADNLDAIRFGKNCLDLRKTMSGPCIVVGAGPSVEKFNHLDKLKDTPYPIIATDRQLIPLLKRGVVPEFVISVDADPIVGDFYKDPIVNEYKDRVRAIFGHQVHKSVVENFAGEKYWFIILLDEPFSTPKSISRVIYWMSNEKTMAQSYGNNGGFAWAFADFCGFNPIVLVGIDFSYGPDIEPMNTMFWKGFLEKRKGNVKETIRLDYRWDTNPFGHKVLTDGVFDSYRQVLQHGILQTETKTINCSPFTVLYGPRIETMQLEEVTKLSLQV